MHKQCLECGTKLIGRADKKFCSDDCRSTYHNRLNSDSNNFMRTVNNILRRNRRILQNYHHLGMINIERDSLIREGFAFGYYTNEKREQDGKVSRFCYELGYKEVDTGNLSLVKLQC
jgi:predicted nucleic acid-binding Zn ribbon protein